LISSASLKSPATLREHTIKELGEIAKKVGVDNWRGLKKEQLVQSLVRHAKRREAAKAKKAAASRTPVKSAARKTAARKTAARKTAARKTAARTTAARTTTATARNGATTRAQSAAKAKASTAASARAAKSAEKRPVKTTVKASAPTKSGRTTPKAKPPAPKVSHKKLKRIQQIREARETYMDLSSSNADETGEKDRIVMMVRDAYWLQVNWQLTRLSINRAQAAMAQMWHTAVPTLRVYEVDVDNATMAAERISEDIRIHGGVDNWYIPVREPPKSFRVEIGYLASDGKFFGLTRSNTVTTPPPGVSDSLDNNWSDIAQDYERVYAMSGGYADDHSSDELQELFEERLRRPMGAPSLTTFGVGAERGSLNNRSFDFELDAEMIIFGTTKPSAHVTLAGEPVKIRPDGTFTVRLSMPDRRQVLPVVAHSADGVEQRTIVLAVERNTKVMEPVINEANE